MIVAIVGNAAEHGGAVVVAHRGKVRLAAEIALSSGAQVAVFLIPAVALLSWAIHPLAFSFRPVEIAALGGSALVVASVLRRPQVEPAGRRRADPALRGRRRCVLHLGRSLSAQRAGDRLDRVVDVVVADPEMRHGAEHTGVKRSRDAHSFGLQPLGRVARL